MAGRNVEPGQELLTDLYELTMAQAYFEHERFAPATFSLFSRRLPQTRAYLVAAGLEDVLDYLETLQFSQESLAYLESTGIFSPSFLHYLAGLRFTGDAWAVPEGRICFADEPLIEATAPVIEAQVVETFVMNRINFQTVIASKAARCVAAAPGKTLVDFSLRRTHGSDAGLRVARSCYIAGMQATSNVLAGRLYGIPISGTMAHSFVSSYEHEIDAFRAFAETFPGRCVLLIDTYDTIDGAHKAAQVGREMEARGQRLQGVRLDSGDMLALSREVRRILDEAGLAYAQVIASGGLDEYEIGRLLADGAPIDGFGIGTKLGVAADAPWLDVAYKIVEFDGRPVMKLSAGKRSFPGAKQVFRHYDSEGLMRNDILGLRDEALDGEPLLQQVMAGGKRLSQSSAPIEDARSRFRDDFARLPGPYKALEGAPGYPVEISEGLRGLSGQLEQEVREALESELGES